MTKSVDLQKYSVVYRPDANGNLIRELVRRHSVHNTPNPERERSSELITDRTLRINQLNHQNERNECTSCTQCDSCVRELKRLLEMIPEISNTDCILNQFECAQDSVELIKDPVHSRSQPKSHSLKHLQSNSQNHSNSEKKTSSTPSSHIQLHGEESRYNDSNPSKPSDPSNEHQVILNLRDENGEDELVDCTKRGQKIYLNFKRGESTGESIKNEESGYSNAPQLERDNNRSTVDPPLHTSSHHSSCGSSRPSSRRSTRLSSRSLSRCTSRVSTSESSPTVEDVCPCCVTMPPRNAESIASKPDKPGTGVTDTKYQRILQATHALCSVLNEESAHKVWMPTLNQYVKSVEYVQK